MAHWPLFIAIPLAGVFLARAWVHFRAFRARLRQVVPDSDLANEDYMHPDFADLNPLYVLRRAYVSTEDARLISLGEQSRKSLNELILCCVTVLPLAILLG